jgi:hypothetical protein
LDVPWQKKYKAKIQEIKTRFFSKEQDLKGVKFV